MSLLVLIATFKPNSKLVKSKLKSKPVQYASTTTAVPSAPTKAAPTKAHLAREIQFDLRVARLSLLADIVSNTFVTVAPSPSTSEGSNSQTFFIIASAFTSFASGVVPAMQSLALCIMQARALREGDGAGGEVDVGRLFGGMAVLQAVGQMILGVCLSFLNFLTVPYQVLW
jgi:hypothetical protein